MKVAAAALLALGIVWLAADRSQSADDRALLQAGAPRVPVVVELFRRSGVYTPQMVVDGRAELVGSDAGTARREIAKAARERKAKVAVARESDSSRMRVRVRVRVEALPASGPGDVAEVVLAVVEDDLHTQVPRGENSGRRLSHTAVVRRLEVIGSLEAAGQLFERRVEVSAEPGWNRAKLRAVAFVQERMSRRILGAARVAL